MAIKILRGNSTTRASSQRVLEDGQPLHEKDTNKLYVGDGTTQAKNLRCITTDRLKTSETRPKAEVKSGTGTVTKEIALLEDIPRVGEWVTITVGTNSADSKITEAGTYEVTVLDTYELLGFYGTTLVHWDGSGQIAQSVYTNTNLDSSNNTVALYTTHVIIRTDGALVVQGGFLQKDNNPTATWHYGSYDIKKYKFRKVF